MVIYCRNCRKIFNAKNALFCSFCCYKFYTNALERKADTLSEQDTNQIKMSSTTVLKYEQTNCDHEYSKNGTMSCRKCGHTSVSRIT